MKIYSEKTVWEASLDRIRWLFDEFPNIVVSTSGGKDSTVVLELALIVAREKGRLPLKVFFLDQEAEWQATIDMVRDIMGRPEVEPLWFQIPFRIFNATSRDTNWLDAWAPDKRAVWMREKEPVSFKENVYGVDRFAKLFEVIPTHLFPGVATAYLAGVRTEESPIRFVSLTHDPTYKGRTWGKVLSAKHQHFTFYPIYDWAFSDVWGAIAKNGWRYNRLYDIQHRYGMQHRNMRVSNVNHETAVHSLFYMQEVEPDTWERLTARLPGVDSAGKAGADDYFKRELPPVFSSWKEYRNYLLEKLITKQEWRDSLREKFERHDFLYEDEVGDKIHKIHVACIIANDWEGAKLIGYERQPNLYRIRNKKLGRAIWTPNSAK